MSFNITSTVGAITAAINAFNEKYHEDYFRVRHLAKNYLTTVPTLETASSLADVLCDALTSWGAGTRVAPSCKSIDVIAAALCKKELRDNLANLEASIPYLAINTTGRILNSGSPFTSVSSFDECLIGTLHNISESFFDGNTNVTYPMKSLLLLTGLMPAFDSQVKGGLKIAGVTGVKMTQYLMPLYGSTNAKKICSLPFYIVDCVSRSFPVISREVAASKYSKLSDEFGRIFDILLFVQNGLTTATAVVQFSPRADIRWYSI